MAKAQDAKKTVKFIDEYCEVYRDLFPEVMNVLNIFIWD
jgi:hypothetical protein